MGDGGGYGMVWYGIKAWTLGFFACLRERLRKPAHVVLERSLKMVLESEHQIIVKMR